MEYKDIVKMLTTIEAAEILGVSRVRVFQLIKDGRLPAQKVGRDLQIAEKDLEAVKERKVGRPPKVKKENTK